MDEEMKALREDVAVVLARYEHDYDGNWPEDAVRAGLAAVSEKHSGDCRKQPWSCLRCQADEVYKRADAILALSSVRALLAQRDTGKGEVP